MEIQIAGQLIIMRMEGLIILSSTTITMGTVDRMMDVTYHPSGNPRQISYGGAQGQPRGFATDENDDGFIEQFHLHNPTTGQIVARGHDSNGDGVFEHVAFDANGDGNPEVFRQDADANGAYDSFVIDTNADGQADQFGTTLIPMGLMIVSAWIPIMMVRWIAPDTIPMMTVSLIIGRQILILMV